MNILVNLLLMVYLMVIVHVGVVEDSQESEESLQPVVTMVMVWRIAPLRFNVLGEEIQIVSLNITRSVSIRCLARKEVLSQFLDTWSYSNLLINWE